MKLKEICTVFSDGDWIESKSQSDKGIRLIQTGNIGEGKYLEKTERAKYISEDTFKELKCTEIFSGDILVSRLPEPIGRACIIPDKSERMITAVDCTICRVNENIANREYICYFMQSQLYYNRLLGNVTGTTRKRISRKNLGNIELVIPTLNEQKAIVKKLNYLTKGINLRRKELEYLDTLIKARFVEMFGDARKNPNKYDTVSFIDIVEYMGDIGSNGANKVVVDHLDMKDKEDYAMMVRFTNFTKNDFTDDVKYVSKEAYDFFKKSQIFGGELIICKIGSAGQNYVMPYLNRPVSLGLNQIMVRIKDNILMPYLYQYLHTDYGEFLISGCINGAVTKTITKTELKKIPVMLPPMELQREFVAFVEQVDKSKVVYQIIINKLTFLQKICYNNYKEQYHIPG